MYISSRRNEPSTTNTTQEKGSGVFFGVSITHKGRVLPKKTPDPFSCLTFSLAILSAIICGCGQSPDPTITQQSESALVDDYDTQVAQQTISADGDSPASKPEMTDLEIDAGNPPLDKSAVNEFEVNKAVLARRRAELDETVWQRERLAQHYEQALVRLWDDLLAQDGRDAGDKFNVLKSLPLDSITISSAAEPQRLDHGIELIRLDQAPHELTNTQWQTLLGELKHTGYRIVQSEWHHARFDPDEGTGARSTIAMAVYVVNEQQQQRIVLQGNLVVRWQPKSSHQGIPRPRTVNATNLTALSRVGEPVFEEIFTVDRARPDTRSGVQPVLVYDLNRDGLPEIVLGGSNQVFWNHGGGKFEEDQLCKFPEKIFETGLVADVTGDGNPDYIVPGSRGDLLMYAGDTAGRFLTRPIGKARGGGPLRQPQVVTAGDIDHDGDLDLWIAQYKISYVGGQMPKPYYDANDGFPAYLLLNDGSGRFEPFTEEAGLGEKRHRRTYGSSFVDLDQDGDLDLLVVSDFAGIDVYYNDGTGYFTDMTDRLVDERHIFGMAVTFSDYNLDGRLDFFVTGMASTTARRLDYMKLGRKDQPDIHMMRARMGFGNRMYLAAQDRFVEPAFRDQVARTGWTWGATSFDFDNDGDKDIFVANGHSSGQSTKDHCTHFWCHDIYEGDSAPNPAVAGLFKDVLAGYSDRTESWDGYQKSVLLMNIGGQGFQNIAFLMGVGQQYDGRAVVGDDIDGDGLVDLLVVEDRWSDGQILHLYRNRMRSAHNWIGVRLHEEAAGRSPLGARIVVHTPNTKQVGCIVAGDSIHAQHSTSLHFGLGQEDQVTAIEVYWPGGRSRHIEAPKINQYHLIGGQSP